jgi:hypothetical protein
MAGEGCFFIKENKSRNKAGVRVQLVFRVSQHIRDQDPPPPPPTLGAKVDLFLINIILKLDVEQQEAEGRG